MLIQARTRNENHLFDTIRFTNEETHIHTIGKNINCILSINNLHLFVCLKSFLKSFVANDEGEIHIKFDKSIA